MKLDINKTNRDHLGITFIPIVVYMRGNWHKVVLSTLTKLGGQGTKTVGKEEADMVRQLRLRLFVMLMRDNMATSTPLPHPPDMDGDEEDEV